LKSNVRSAAVVVGLIVLGIAAALILYFFQVFNRSDYFLPGVTVAGTKVSGYSTQEAIDAVQRRLDQAYATKVTFYKDDYTYETTMGSISVPVNVSAAITDFSKQELLRDWKHKILNMDGSNEVSYPLNIKYDNKRLEEMIQKWAEFLQVEPQNARLEMDSRLGLTVIPGQPGQMLDKKATLEQLPQRWQDVSGDLRIAIVMEKRQPAVDEESLSNMGELAEYSTWYNPGEIDRSHNLMKAASKINTSVVLPGKIFSFNQTVGKRIVENGYRDAMVIVNGRFEPGLGGGICQVSSTLYNACLLAGLKIVERHNHALAVAYVPLGRDATVAYGVQDFRFQNNTASPIYIKSVAGGGKLSVTIYGNLDYKQNIGVSHVVDKVTNFSVGYQNDPSVPPGTQKVDHKGIPGYIVRSFRTWYDSTGKAIKTEQLARDSYQPLNETILVGPPLVEPPPPVEEETPPVEPQPPATEPGPLPEEPVPPTYNNAPAI
jgi:vancomycin resistance protein YoaR